MKNNMVNTEEFNELIDCARETKKKFINALKNKNILEGLNEFDPKSSVHFISEAKLQNPRHEYRISFVKRAVVMNMCAQLERDIKTLLGEQ